VRHGQALNELQRVVMATEEQDLAANLPQLVVLKKPFPAGKARNNVVVPVVGGTHVFLNGDKAPFADVIAPRRLCQCKLSEDVTKTVTLDLREFVKMGIVKKICDRNEDGQARKMQGMESGKVKQEVTDQTMRMQRSGALLSALSQYWVGPSSLSQEKNEAATPAWPSAIALRQFYPGCLFVGDTIFGPQPECEMYNCTMGNNDLLSKVDDKYGKQGGSSAVVTQADVTFDLIITSDTNISEVLCMELRENMSVDFLFARDFKGLKRWSAREKVTK
ncbi:MAG: hypothetical protein SGBAC_012166, partial [Bacillariaceae sp.]